MTMTTQAAAIGATVTLLLSIAVLFRGNVRPTEDDLWVLTSF